MAGGPGLVVVAGLDARAPAGTASEAGRYLTILPSGRSAIFRILVRQILSTNSLAQAIVVADGVEALRLPRQFRHRASLLLVEPGQSYARVVESAVRRRPDLLVLDRLSEDVLPAVLSAVERGQRVLTQIETVFRGAEVARQIAEMGLAAEQMSALSWIVTVHRLETLCPHCKQPAPPTPEQIAQLGRLCPELDPAAVLAAESGLPGFHRAAGCAHCQQTGRSGEVTAFDVFDAGQQPGRVLEQPSRLSLEQYLLGLAARGQVPLDDVIYLDQELLRHTARLLSISELALADTIAARDRKIAELEAANQVLKQRTDALISLEGIGQALITSTGLDDLAARLCRHACDLCGADRAILYFFRADGQTAEILAAIGWDPVPIRQPIPAEPVRAEGGAGPVAAYHHPPGVPRRLTDTALSAIRAGLRLPLVAQGKQVGLMIVHTTKAGFGPGQVALVEMFANQAALAIQRTGLIEDLKDKITQLQAAQAELVKKERQDRELELARQVQQSVLPHIFPLVGGLFFGARSQAARQVGGDFYDVILLDADRVGVVIGDVSDKGMPAALYMALARSLLLAEARRNASPRDVLASVHRLLLELGQPHMFVTVFYGIIDAPARELTFCRAGHDRPILIRGAEVKFLGGEGTFLGFPEMNELRLSEEHLALLPGDRLVMYTDGLSDARSPDGRAFGLDRLAGVFRAHIDLPPDELCTAVLAEVAAHQDTAEQYDDMTLLVVDVGR